MKRAACTTLFCLAACTGRIAHAASSSCTWSQASGASYDVSALKLTHVVTGGDIDCTAQPEQEYTYAWNPCGSVNAADLGFSTAKADCAAATAGGTATVLQYDSASQDAGNKCKGAGRSAEQSWALVDASDRSAGVQITYSTAAARKDTDLCHTANVFRQTRIRLYCDERATGSKPTSVKVTEPAGPKACEYEISAHSVHACPTECARSSDGKACGGHGLCLTDTGTNTADTGDDKARCFCNNGWQGDACDQGGPADHNSTGSDLGGAIALLVILFLLVIGLGVVLVMLVKQIKGYRDDTANYLAISGGEGEGSF